MRGREQAKVKKKKRGKGKAKLYRKKKENKGKGITGREGVKSILKGHITIARTPTGREDKGRDY